MSSSSPYVPLSPGVSKAVKRGSRPDRSAKSKPLDLTVIADEEAREEESRHVVEEGDVGNLKKLGARIARCRGAIER